MENPNRSTGVLAMAATAFVWSIGGLLIKVIHWSPIAIAGTRSLIASLVIFAVTMASIISALRNEEVASSSNMVGQPRPYRQLLS